jgi:hypothetical protein
MPDGRGLLYVLLCVVCILAIVYFAVNVMH